MKSKKKTPFESIKEQGYKKKYLERLQEEQDTKREVREWSKHLKRHKLLEGGSRTPDEGPP